MTFIGPHRAGTAYALDCETRGIARFSQPAPLHGYPHVIREYCGSYGGRSSWGYRVTCTGCGAIDACVSGSSVTSEDGPPRFGWHHRDCGATTAYVDPFGRITVPTATAR